jgi:hypothetical protein
MQSCPGILKQMWPARSCCLLTILFFSLQLFGQETNSRASGRVFSENNENIDGATVIVIHEPTQNEYSVVTTKDGYFHLFNLKPGGPYSIIISSAGYETSRKNNLFAYLTGDYFFLDNAEITDFILQKKTITLSEVITHANNSNSNKSGIETNISRSALNNMLSISRNFQDFVRLVPQAKTTGDGVMSLAGQNNRFNAFFIDGANNTDMRGISVSGMNGGQTGSPPISVEALEEINVLLSPYNVQYGNFTGGSINAITRSGSNENKSSAWYYFRNENLAGRSPQPLEKPGSPGGFYRPRLSEFFNQTFGVWNSGALIKNKLFYFVLFEKQSETRPQPFNILDYRGTSNQQQLDELTNFLKTNYHYDPGSFLETKDELDATRVNIKLDWNATLKDKFTLSYRYNNAERLTAPRPSSVTAIAFHNSGIIIPQKTHSISFEWKHFLKSDRNNRFLFTFTSQQDYRKWIGQPFPFVTILDGNGTLNFGSEANTGLTKFKGADFSLFDVFTYVRKKHVFTTGTDINYSNLNGRLLLAYFGAYQFRSLNDFMNAAAPSRLQRSYYPTEDNSSKYQLLRTSFFINDEVRFRANLKINFGLRLDVNSVLSKPATDQFFNDSAVSIISRYYDLDGARSGKAMKADWTLSPRFGIEYKLSKIGIILKGGAGIFTGHTINAWIADVFNSNTASIDIAPQQFIPDPYNQPTAESLNIDPANLKGILNLIAKGYKFPSIFRTSIAAEKKIKNNWTFSIEGIFTKNIHEALFRNVNILPPTRISAMPDSRNIYSLNTSPSKIPLRSNGINPYAQVVLLTNNHNKKGYAYSFSLIINKQAGNFSFNSSYTYGRSNILFEVTGTQTLIVPQWRNMETVNGRNFTTLSTSDNDLKHRIAAWVSKKINYSKNKMATTVSIFYNGQSGSPYSYVYTNSMINDNGKRNEPFDLIYIPTNTDLASMSFAPITGAAPYTSQQQKDALNAFIENDKYLKKHRGEFAKRNRARLPFTHIIDLRLQQDFKITIKGKPVGFTITYDVFNFTNMLNRNWGRIYFLLNDSYPLITFAGYSNTTTLTQEYQFLPINGKPYSVQSSTLPGNSARWISQLGLKVNLN